MLAGIATTVAPLVYLTALKEPFRLPKLALSESLALLSLVFLCARLVDAIVAGRPDERRALRLAALVAAPMAAVATLGLLTSSHPAHVSDALPSLLIAIGATVAWSLAIEPRSLRRLLDLTMAPAAILALVGILQFHDLWQPFAIDPSEIDPRVRITSLLGNVGELSAYLVLPLLLAQVRLWEAWLRRSSWPDARASLVLWSLGGALCLYALLVTSTLTALLALAAATLVLWLVLVERRVRFAMALAAVALVGLLSLSVGPLRPRAMEKLAALRSGDWNHFLSGRLDGWRCGLYMARSRPLVGVGHGAFRAEFAPAKLALIDRGVEFYEGQRTASFANAHNETIEVAAEWGLPGTLSLAVAIAALAIAARRTIRARHDAPTRADGAVAAAGLVSFAALALAFFPFRIASTGYQAVLFFAWLIATAAATAAGAGESASGSSSRRRAVSAIAAAVLLTITVLHVRRAVDRLSASRALQRIESATALMLGAGRAVPPLVQENRRALLELHERDPSEPAILTALAAQYVLLGRFQEALDEYERGLEVEPRPELYFGRGNMQLRLGDREAARASFATAVALSPQLALELPVSARATLLPTANAAPTPP